MAEEMTQELGIIKLDTFTGGRGDLTVFEPLPFEVKRLFWIHDVPAHAVRGGHAHKECEQALVAVHGSVVVRAVQNGHTIQWRLHLPEQALYIPPGIWLELSEFSKDCVVLVLCSQFYDEEEYVRERGAV